MRVYVKKEEKNSILFGILITIMLFGSSVGILYSAFKSGKDFIDILAESGINLLFAIVFFMFSIGFIYTIIKKTKRFKVELINKKIENYNGQQITYMEFSAEKEQIQEDADTATYKCYTIGENNLVVGNEYVLKIKELNQMPKYVEELNVNNHNKVVTRIPSMTLEPVFIGVSIIFWGILIFCILGVILYPQHAVIYLIVECLIGCTFYKVYKLIKFK